MNVRVCAYLFVQTTLYACMFYMNHLCLDARARARAYIYTYICAHIYSNRTHFVGIPLPAWNENTHILAHALARKHAYSQFPNKHIHILSHEDPGCLIVMNASPCSNLGLMHTTKSFNSPSHKPSALVRVCQQALFFLCLSGQVSALAIWDPEQTSLETEKWLYYDIYWWIEARDIYAYVAIACVYAYFKHHERF
jgi:hypothetical protein